MITNFLIMLKRSISTLTIGSDFSKRIFFQENNQKISPFHDIKLLTHSNRFIFPAIIEISRHSIAKFEVSRDEPYNPIKQDTRKSKLTGESELRYYARFPLFNYGMLPQTWENPFIKDSKFGLLGDGDPLDILEIGSQALDSGSLINVKILGALCLIDQGEIDWKIICINHADPLYKKINDPHDVEKHFPGKIDAIIDWLENIKVFDGKDKNKVEGNVMGPESTLEVVLAGHHEWKNLVAGKYPQSDVWISKKPDEA